MADRPPRRVPFFNQMRVREAELVDEQDYHIEMRRRHNRDLHGKGVVNGLGVRVVEGPDGPGLVVDDGFALDHDRGSAIRLAGRADVYMGIGPRAELLAGHTMSEGRLYYVFVK